MVHSIMERADKSLVRDAPYPIMIVENALPEAYYAELEASYPTMAFVAGRSEVENNKIYLKPAADILDNPEVPAVWREFMAYHCSEDFYREVIDFWEDWLERLHPALERNFGKSLRDFSLELRRPGKHDNPENRAADVMMDCQFGMHSPVSAVTSARGPHVDNRAKLFAALLYFRHADDRSTGGDLELYRLKGRPYPKRQMTKIDPKFVEQVDSVPYGANKLVMWPNSGYHIHGVSPRAITDMPRRYVNFLGECYGGKRDGFFTALPSQGLSLRGLLDHVRP